MAYISCLQLFHGVQLNINNEDTFYFKDREAQETYFNSLVATNISFNANDFKFIREDGYVKVSRPHDELQNCNYLRFKNVTQAGAYTIEKWYYAFITDIEYINDTTTGIYFVIDVLQTWLPLVDYELNECFIERQHATSDNIGDNIATETIKPFQLKTYEEDLFDVLGEGFYIAVLFVYQEGYFTTQLTISSETVSGIEYSTDLGAVPIDGTVSGSTLLLFDGTSDGIEQLRTAIRKTNITTSRDYIDIDSVTNMYMIPKSFFSARIRSEMPLIMCGDISSSVWTARTLPTKLSRDGGNTWEVYQPALSRLIEPNFSLTNIGSVSVRNKKLLTSQYSNYCVTNIYGNTGIYQPEGFTKQGQTQDELATPSFNIMTSALPPSKMCIYPIAGEADYYYGATNVNEQILPLGELPAVTINIDTYKDWIARKTLQTMQLAVPFALAGYAGYSGAVAVATTSAMGDLSKAGKPYYGAAKQAHVDKVVSQAKAKYLSEKGDSLLTNAMLSKELRTANDIANETRPTPICSGNGNDLGSTLNAHKIFNVAFKKIAPVESEIERIDNYFTAYGYAINKIQKPHVKVRSRFTYIKTRGARNTAKTERHTINGIPAKYLEEINSLFDNGIRFWVSQDISTLNSANGILPSAYWDWQ